MPKLYFRYGTMNSSKTMNLLMVAHNFEEQKKTVIVLKPMIDTRFGVDNIKSRTGMNRKADYLLSPDKGIPDELWKCIYTTSCILVDEAQFLTPKQVDELRTISLHKPVICYGLRTDYRSELFPGSKRLMELADSIEEIKTICTYCMKKAIINMKHINNKAVKTGDGTPDLGCEEKYLPVCWKCWDEQLTYEHQSKQFDDYNSLSLTQQLNMPLFTSREQDTPDIFDDSLTYPTVTKEKLDAELDAYQRMR